MTAGTNQHNAVDTGSEFRSGRAEAGTAGRVLVVDGDSEVERQLRPVLEAERFEVRYLSGADDVCDVVREWDPAVLLLDPVLPDGDGIDLCRELRTFSDLYVIMLSDRTGEIDLLIGLSVGADDYVVKPFRAREIAARIKAMMRRPRGSAVRRAEAEGVRVFGDCRIDPMARELVLDSQVVDLTPLEFKIIDTLSSNPRVVFTRANLIERVWGPNWFGGDHVVDVHVSNLRRKLAKASTDPDREFVRTVRGHGYRFMA